jgi:predicted nucleic acid-binding protein
MIAPDFLNVEALSTLRRLERLRVASSERITQAVADLQMAPITRWPTTALVRLVWDLRANLSAYDACYVALARAHACQLVTGDARLTRAPGMKTVTILV